MAGTAHGFEQVGGREQSHVQVQKGHSKNVILRKSFFLIKVSYIKWSRNFAEYRILIMRVPPV